MIRKKWLELLLVFAWLVGGIFICWPEKKVSAAGTQERVMNFRVVLLGDTNPVTVGTVPEGKQLILKDFTSPANSPCGTLEILTDSEITGEICSTTSDGRPSGFDVHFETGIVIKSGQELAIRTPCGWVDQVLPITIAGILK